MSDERERVLRLLEEGKVTAEQAARLIEALGAVAADKAVGPRREGRMGRVRMAELDRIPDIVASAVSSAMKSGFGSREDTRTEFPGKSSLFLKSVSGDVTVAGWDEDRITVESEAGMTRVREREDIVMVRAISGDFKIRLPRESRLEVTTVSGDVTVRDTSGRFGLKGVSGDVVIESFAGDSRVQTVSGDVRLSRVAGSTEVESKSGDIKVLAAGVVSGALTSESGDVELTLPPGTDVLLDLECEEKGAIEFDAGFEHQIIEETGSRLRVRLGAGAQMTPELRVRTGDGRIVVRRAKEE